MSPEPDNLFTGGRKRVDGVRVLYVTFLCLVFFVVGFGLGYMA